MSAARFAGGCYELRTEIHGAMIVQDLEYTAPSVRESVLRQVLDTADAQVREKLIEMGWTPPANQSARKPAVGANQPERRRG